MFRNLGVPCIGPKMLLNRTFVVQRSNGSLIGFHSLRLRRKAGLGLILGPRCESCRSILKTVSQLKRLDIFADDDQSQICLLTQCSADRWGHAKYCTKHLALGVYYAGRRTLLAAVNDFNTDGLHLERRWIQLDSFNTITTLLSNLENPGWTDDSGYRPKVLIVDTEFSPYSAKRVY